MSIFFNCEIYAHKCAPRLKSIGYREGTRIRTDDIIVALSSYTSLVRECTANPALYAHLDFHQAMS